MGLTRRQSQAIQQMIIQESRAAYQSQQERHRILGEVEGDDELVLEGKGSELSTAIRHAIGDLIEAFQTNHRIYEGSDLDGGKAAKRAAEYLYNLIEADVKETVSMLESGDFDGMDQNEDGMGFMDQHMGEELPPMHPRHGHDDGSVHGPGHEPVVGGPAKHVSTVHEPESGYDDFGAENFEDEMGRHLPPMHPRGRR